jgi:hypothetical protein
VTALQKLLAGAALVIDGSLAVALLVVAWPFGVAAAVFALVAAAPLLAGGRRRRFRATAGAAAAFHLVAGAALLLAGGGVFIATGLVLAAAAIAPSPDDRGTRSARWRGHAAMLVVAALVVLGLAPFAAWLWPG